MFFLVRQALRNSCDIPDKHFCVVLVLNKHTAPFLSLPVSYEVADEMHMLKLVWQDFSKSCGLPDKFIYNH